MWTSTLNKTYFTVLKHAIQVFIDNGIENGEYDAMELLLAACKIDKTYYYIHKDDDMKDDEYKLYESYVNRRCSHEPLQHITGYAGFYGHDFRVNENVLIPRYDTESVVEEALKHINDGDSVLDMCTGSGCIIITTALEKKLSYAVGADISEDALKVASTNADDIMGAEKIKESCLKLVKSDLFENVVSPKGGFDVIISNPPYIKTDVIETLSEEVKIHDPYIALDGKEDGLYFYRRITQESCKYIKKSGWLIYEIGYDQAESVSEIMKINGYNEIKVIKDLSGLDRGILAKYTG